MMSNEEATKIGLTGIGGIITYMANNFTPLIYILIFLEILDYFSFLIASKKANTFTSEHVFWNFVQKLMYFFLIAVAFCFDYTISMASNVVSLDFSWPSIFGILSVCYLASTEAISILENMAIIGVEIPFLTSAIKGFRKKIDEKGTLHTDETKNEKQCPDEKTETTTTHDKK